MGNNSYYEPSADDGTAFEDGSTRESFSAFKVNSQHPDGSSSYGTLVPFVDPNRDMGSYIASLGQGSTFNDWISAQRAQTREGGWYEPTLTGAPPAFTAAAEIKHISDGFTTGAPTPNAQIVNVVATDPNASEAGLDPGTFQVTRTGTAAQLLLPLSVSFDLSGSSATLNSDYTLSQSSITFPGAYARLGATSQSMNITVTPIADNLVEGDETVKLNIRGDSHTPPLYVTGLNPLATVTIADSTTTVNVQTATPSISEDSTTPATFTLTRSGSTSTALTVNVDLVRRGDVHHRLFAEFGRRHFHHTGR